jgi:hypothetical protein
LAPLARRLHARTPHRERERVRPQRAIIATCRILDGGTGVAKSTRTTVSTKNIHIKEHAMKKILLGLVAGLCLTTFAARAIADEKPAGEEKKPAKKGKGKKKAEGGEKKEEAPAK